MIKVDTTCFCIALTKLASTYILKKSTPQLSLLCIISTVCNLAFYLHVCLTCVSDGSMEQDYSENRSLLPSLKGSDLHPKTTIHCFCAKVGPQMMVTVNTHQR